MSDFWLGNALALIVTFLVVIAFLLLYIVDRLDSKKSKK